MGDPQSQPSVNRLTYAMLHHGHPFSLDGCTPTTRSLGAPWNMTTLQKTGDAHETIPAIKSHKKP